MKQSNTNRTGSSAGMVWRRFRRNKTATAALRILYLLVFVAFFADFIANEKPLFCKLDEQVYFPVLNDYAVALGLDQWESHLVRANWRQLDYEAVIFPPIPYSPSTIDRRNMNFKGPAEQQRVDTWRFHHWMGTDAVGRDVAAGMVHGTRIALSVGLIAMGIATLLGIFLGSLAGYFGDRGLQISYGTLALNALGLAAGLFYAFGTRSYALQEGLLGWELLKSLGIFFAFIFAANLLARPASNVPILKRRFFFPADILVMRLIEIFNSIPTLLLLLSVVAILQQPSLFYVMVIIGLIRWTGIARFIRAEMLRIRQQEYIEAAHALGFSHRRTLFRHALPNALTPVLIAIAFGIAGSILLEASLSFLGIGLPPETVTWGSLLKTARYTPRAWWLAVFPGLAIFVTVTVFNLIGEGLSEALNPKEGSKAD